jgi:hypothetical protein
MQAVGWQIAVIARDRENKTFNHKGHEGTQRKPKSGLIMDAKVQEEDVDGYVF